MKRKKLFRSNKLLRILNSGKLRRRLRYALKHGCPFDLDDQTYKAYLGKEAYENKDEAK